MSDTSTDQEADEEVDREDVDEDEQPDIEAEEMADLSAVADEIEDAAGAGGDDQDDDVVDEDQDDVDELEPGRSRGWGDVYVATITTSLNAIIDERGKDGAEPVDEQMARDLHLDEAFDEWMAQRGRSDLEPGQEVLLGTLILASSTLATKTDIVGEIAADVGGGAGA
jgi:hypothetical protein